MRSAMQPGAAEGTSMSSPSTSMRHRARPAHLDALHLRSYRADFGFYARVDLFDLHLSGRELVADPPLFEIEI